MTAVNSATSQEKQLFNLKFTAKQLNRMQAKCAKQEKDEVQDQRRPIRIPHNV